MGALAVQVFEAKANAAGTGVRSPAEPGPVFAGRNATGKRRYASKLVPGSKADARKALTALAQEVNRGVQVEPGKRTLAAYLEEWLKTSAKPRVSENTFRDYEKHLRRHVIPALGSKRLEQVTPGQIRALYQGMADKGLGRTVQYTHAILRQALQGAVTDRLLRNDPLGLRVTSKYPLWLFFSAYRLVAVRLRYRRESLRRIHEAAPKAAVDQ